ncbi:hypothetical protein DPEC_G00222690, partial [Dallia pectoralis]
LARSSFSNIHFAWYHSFISPADSLNGFGTIFPMRTKPFMIFSLHFLHPAVPRLAYSTQNLCSAMSGWLLKGTHKEILKRESKGKLYLQGGLLHRELSNMQGTVPLKSGRRRKLPEYL